MKQTRVIIRGHSKLLLCISKRLGIDSSTLKNAISDAMIEMLRKEKGLGTKCPCCGDVLSRTEDYKTAFKFYEQMDYQYQDWHKKTSAWNLRSKETHQEYYSRIKAHGALQRQLCLKCHLLSEEIHGGNEAVTLFFGAFANTQKIASKARSISKMEAKA